MDVSRRPAVSVVMLDGERVRLSLRDTLARAHEVASLAPRGPLGRAPLLRLLIALALDLLRPRPGLSQWRLLWQSGAFEADAVERFFADHDGRFDLFDAERPFGQVAGLMPSAGGPKPASAVLLGVPGGNNVPIFSAVNEGQAVEVPAEDALEALLTLLAYDTAAIKTGALGDPRVSAGKTTGNPTGPLGQLGTVLLEGRNLYETLLLNLPDTPLVDGDEPLWRRDLDATWESRQPTGVLELLVWVSRRVRLVPAEDGRGVVGAVVAAGDRLSFTPVDLEPHTRWREPKGRTDVSRVPMRWPAGQQAWRGLRSLTTLHDDSDGSTSRLLSLLGERYDVVGEDYPLSLWCISTVYGNQSAVIEDVVADRLPLPLAALRADVPEVGESLREVAERAEQIRRVLNDLDSNIRRASGGEPLAWSQGRHPGDDAMGLLTIPTERLLRGLQRQPARSREGGEAWQLAVHAVIQQEADRLLDAALPAAFAGRDVRLGSSERRLRLADAETFFFSKLRQILPAAYARPEEAAS